MTYRKLTSEEISQLSNQGCFCEDWNRITVTENFTANYCRSVEFSGDIKLGRFGNIVTTIAGMTKRSGIYNAHIHNVTIGDGVYIRNVSNGIANYTIENDVFIENVELVAVDDETTFGNGVLVPVMNESGGRSVPMFTGLSAQLAYILAFYRHRPELVTSLKKIIHEKVDSFRASEGTIGAHSRIINCETITNVAIGPSSYLHGVKRLNNATLNSTDEHPVEIGNGTILDSVIVNGNSKVLDGSISYNCFIAEGCDLSKHFSAENSLFFSNFIGHHGEAYGIFAGPHTATHHKSTLLISAYLSFLNAGSGSNQSNHLYKLGPLHQGVIDRGSKTGSDSYVLWPAQIGVFTLILGRHMNHPDVSELPYSYLIEDEGNSLLIPGVNIKSVGTIRDSDKWPTRDKRSTTSVDIINYDLLTPYSAGKMKKGQAILRDLEENSHHNERQCRYNGAVIPKSSIEKGINYYRLGIVKYTGNILSERLLENDFSNIAELRKLLIPKTTLGQGSWIDMAGMVIPNFAVEELILEIEEGKLPTIESITERLHTLNNSYEEWAWSWCVDQIENFLNKKIEELSVDDIRYLLETWIIATEELDDYFVEDAVKEFGPRTKISFGIDGDESVREADFLAVRGSVESNDFINRINEHLTKKTSIYRTVISKLNEL